LRKQNGMPTKATWQKLQIFKIQDGGRPPFWKSLNRHILENRPILMKFGTLHQILNPITATWPIIEILKFEMATAAILKITFFGHNSLTDCPISAKFCTRKQNGMRQRPHDKNCKFSKSKSLNYHYLSENIVGLWQNLVYYSMYWTWWGFQKRYRRFFDVIR